MQPVVPNYQALYENAILEAEQTNQKAQVMIG
jgi:hypothetical protein